MQMTFKYKLKPHKAQVGQFEAWRDLCRRQYNYRLGQRFDWFEASRTRVVDTPRPKGRRFLNRPDSDL